MTDLKKWTTAARENESIEDLYTALNALEELKDTARIWTNTGRTLMEWSNSNPTHDPFGSIWALGETLIDCAEDIINRVEETLE